MAVVGEKVLELQVFAENKDFENDCDSDFEVIEQDDLFEVVPTTEIRLIMRQSNGVSALYRDVFRFSNLVVLAVMWWT